MRALYEWPTMLLAIGLSGQVHAQAFQQFDHPGLPSEIARGRQDADLNAFSPYRSGDTPTMRRQKERWALDLRNDINAFIQQDGGTLTPEHRSYVRGEVRRILTGSRF